MSGILTERRPTARKRHTCTLCLLHIEPGTTYRYYTCAAEGTVFTNKEHDECANLVWHEWGMEDGDWPDAAEIQQALAEASR